ncbi:MAG TPA: hypothetical protein VEJ84_17575 [Acidimicrobiales bacterium]|nr:hypothetical protein [Acidimicrobiales bacterium]
MLTPGGTERWFEEVAGLRADDRAAFEQACRRYGIEFFRDSPWTAKLRERFQLA